MDEKGRDVLFGKFEVIECFKKDSYSGVYLANHFFLGKKIILKTLNTVNLSDQTVLHRFKREAKILAQLDHPNLIKVLDFGMHENHFYISFEYFESKNLRAVISENNLTNSDKKDILIQLLNALNIAHQNMIIHRDIKPENILLNSEHHLKIADFGLALMQSEEKLTQDSSVVGTPSYMSPEQLRGEKNFQTDIFSAGIVAYELYTGVNPFSGKNVSDTVNNILNYNENGDTFHFDRLPEDVRGAVRGMLRKNQSERVKSVLGVLDLLGIGGDVYKPVVIENRFYNKYRMYLPAFLVIVIVIAGSFLIFNRPSVENYKSGESISGKTELRSFNEPGGSNPSGTDFIGDSSSSNQSESENGTYKTANNDHRKGKLFVKCLPYAEIYVDGKKLATTPIDDYIELSPGRHRLKLVNPSYPGYLRNITISPERIESITVNFDAIVGYLKCNIYPWGKIFINGKLEGVTPMRPIPLLAGTYKLKINNPVFKDYYEQIKIIKRDTLNFNFNFAKSGEALNSKIKTE